jgi:hypothetical protein
MGRVSKELVNCQKTENSPLLSKNPNQSLSTLEKFCIYKKRKAFSFLYLVLLIPHPSSDALKRALLPLGFFDSDAFRREK